MNPGQYPLALWPPSASTSAAETDHLILAFTALTLFLVVPIFIAITTFAIRYQDGTRVNRRLRHNRDRMLELSWMIIPFVLTLFFFAWGARMFDAHKHPPANAMQIEAIGRQWMWKFQHPSGQAEINDLHVPVGQPVLINMISQDVIHSLLIPAMRIQMEVLPGRYTQLWFQPDRIGTYRILCTEYCGTDHSVMGGLLTVMSAADYQAWLGQGNTQGIAAEGKQLFSALGCSGCHRGADTPHAPTLAGLYEHPVHLADGGTKVADATYLRAKILAPDTDKLPGFRQVMPSYRGRISETEMIPLIAYIKAYTAEDGT